MNSFILQDSSSALWQVTVDDSGILHTTSVGSGTPSTVKLNDPLNDSSWQLGVSTTGLLTTTSISLSANPNFLALASLSGVTNWNIGVSQIGLITTTQVQFPIFPSVDTTRVAGFNYKLPLKISPSYKTLRETPANNRGEVRISLTRYPIWMFEMEVPYIYGDPDIVNDGFQQLIGLYGQCQGGAGPFLFDWLGNNTVSNQVIGNGDGITTTFPMIHTIGGMVELIQNFKSTPTIFVNGVAQGSGAFSIDQYGTLSLASAPGPGVPVSWSGSWYTLCSFLEDELQTLTLIRGNGASSLWTLKSLKFKSVLL